MNDQDIRWEQRFSRYQQALLQLAEAVALYQQRPLSNIEQQGLIQAFEFTHELAWNVMKDYFVYQGNTSITGSRDAIREAFQKGLITDGENWMETIKSRNKTSHTYQQEIADEIAQKIAAIYFDLFQAFSNKMRTLTHASKQ